MRAFIIIAALYLADAINPELKQPERVIAFIGIMFLIGLAMDIIELIKK